MKLLPHDVQRMTETNPDALLLNVLPKKDFEKAHIPGSINVPLETDHFARAVEERAKSDKSKVVLVYCASDECDASTKAAKALERDGFCNVIEFDGGTKAWQEDGHPVESGSPMKK